NSQSSNLEINIISAISYVIDLPDLVLSIIEKLSQDQFRQPQYLKIWDVLLDITIIMDNNKLSFGVFLLKLMRYNKGPKFDKKPRVLQPDGQLSPLLPDQQAYE
ncbi:2364_t:CDS:2, partial [Racocetra persica]